jgi:hypothetical protein
MKARVHIVTARGHGPNSMFPHEVAWVELWSANNPSHKIETSERPATSSKPMWNEKLELEIGAKDKEIVLKMRGKLPSHHAIDEIGSGTYQIQKTNQPSPGSKVVKVPIFASNGKEAGEIELDIEIEP